MQKNGTKLPEGWRDLIPEDEESSLIIVDMHIKPERAFAWFKDRQIFDLRFAFSYDFLPGWKRRLPYHDSIIYEFLRLLSLIGLVVAYCPGQITPESDVIFCTLEIWELWLVTDPEITELRLSPDNPLIRRGKGKSAVPV